MELLMGGLGGADFPPLTGGRGLVAGEDSSGKVTPKPQRLR